MCVCVRASVCPCLVSVSKGSKGRPRPCAAESQAIAAISLPKVRAVEETVDMRLRDESSWVRQAGQNDPLSPELQSE